MKEKIYSLLEILIKFSGDKPDDQLLDKKNKLIEDIENTNEKINNTNKLIESNRYFDEITYSLDKNTIIALRRKIKQLQRDESDLKKSYKKIVEEEKFYNEKINLGKLNVEKYEELLKNISYKLVEKNIDTEYYNTLLNINSSKLDYWNNFVKKLVRELDEKSNYSTAVKANKENFDYEINRCRNRIDEINHNLENELNYFNRQLKEKDEKTLKNLKCELSKLENEYDTLSGSVSFLVLELKDLIEEKSYIYAKAKLNEIIWKLETVPYMLENNYEKLQSDVAGKKKDKELLKDKIANNDYLNGDCKILNDRIKDIHYLLEDNKEDILYVKKLISKLDKERGKKLFEKITNIDVDEDMLANYNADLNHLIEYTVILKNTSLKYLESYKKKLNEEMDELTKRISNKKGLVDEEAKLRDIETIKSLSFDIDSINHRLQNKGDVYEIRDNIEMYIDSLDFEVFLEETKKDNLIYMKVVEIIPPEEMRVA